MLHTTLIALGGQTASGKSEMAVQLAKQLNDCWIVSCDSRQIYKYLNLGTGKVDGQWEAIIYENQLLHTYVYQGVPHFFIDTVSPDKQYTLAHFLSDFKHLCENHILPKYLILCGGTGLYIKAILERYSLDQIKPEHEEEYEHTKTLLQTYSTAKLQDIYCTYKPLDTLNESDTHNSRRLVNHILNHMADSNHWGEPISIPEFEKTYHFAIDCNQQELYKNIEKRLLDRIDQGMIEEVDSLDYLGTDRLLALGLEYRLTHLYLLGQLTYHEYIKKLTLESVNYAQKQLTWLKKQDLAWIRNIDELLEKISQIHSTTAQLN
jgi:tRNA dimethylallyltransferase